MHLHLANYRMTHQQFTQAVLVAGLQTRQDHDRGITG